MQQRTLAVQFKLSHSAVREVVLDNRGIADQEKYALEGQDSSAERH
jgi:hypothetical protein